VADAAAPWNQGKWRLEAEGGQVEVTRTDEVPDLSTDVPVLAALFSGHLSASEAARGGLLSAHSPAALRAADRIFAPHCAPFVSDWF
jgi:predicted acetyltransferase